MKISAATTDTANLSFDPQRLRAAEKIAIFIPGALCRTDIFAAADVWQAEGYGLAHYRFPGLDGRALHPPLGIHAAAAEIVAFANQYPDTPRRILGYSTGAAIALTAAATITGDWRVALMSPAVEKGGGVETAARATRDIAQAMLRAGSPRLSRFWPEYYRLLLFGRRLLHSPAHRALAEAIIAERRGRIVLPQGGLPHAHTSDLRRWRVPQNAQFAAGHCHVFWGAEDALFSKAQIQRYAEGLGAVDVTEYSDQGHLLFASHQDVFDDIFSFFQQS